MGNGGKRKFVFRATGPSQPEPPQFQYPFEVSEEHLDLLALGLSLWVEVGFQCHPSEVTGILVLFAGDKSARLSLDSNWILKGICRTHICSPDIYDGLFLVACCADRPRKFARPYRRHPAQRPGSRPVSLSACRIKPFKNTTSHTTQGTNTDAIERNSRQLKPDTKLLLSNEKGRSKRPDQTDKNDGMAEEVGFEPTVRSHARRFSRPVHSTTLPLLRSTDRIEGCQRFCKPRNAPSSRQSAGNFADPAAAAFSARAAKASVTPRPRQRGVKHAVFTARMGNGENAGSAGKDDGYGQA